MKKTYARTATLKIHAIQTGTVRVKMKVIVQYARNLPTVYLPSHDLESEHRLANAITVPARQDVTA